MTSPTSASRSSAPIRTASTATATESAARPDDPAAYGSRRACPRDRCRGRHAVQPARDHRLRPARWSTAHGDRRCCRCWAPPRPRNAFAAADEQRRAAPGGGGGQALVTRQADPASCRAFQSRQAARAISSASVSARRSLSRPRKRITSGMLRPCPTSVATMTQNARNWMRSRAGNASPASVVKRQRERCRERHRSRMPDQATNAGCCHGG